MTYKIPSDEKVQSVLKNVIKDYRKISTQKKLHQLVSKKLKKGKNKYSVSTNRLRKIAINSDFVKLEIHSREGDPRKSMNKCPVCSDNLKRVKNKTIWGGEVTIEFQCPNCGYWTGKKKRIPTCYVFHYKK